TAQAVSKVIIFNQASEVDAQLFNEAPGLFWGAAKKYEHDISMAESLPDVGTRGCSVVRYIPDSDRSTKAWATNPLAEFSTTAQANSTTTISIVVYLGDLELRDLSIVYGASAAPALHVIATVTPPNSLSTVTAVGFTNPVTITYKGKTIRRQQGLADDDK